VTLGRRGLLVPNQPFICYADAGGPLRLMSGDGVPQRYRVVDPRTGEALREGVRTTGSEPIPDEGRGPRVYLCLP
jgi:hypothetical protein